MNPAPPQRTPPRRRVAPRGRGAFTLIEIMMVVGIMALILAIGIPAFVETFNKTPLRQAVSDITEGLGNARMLAIVSGQPTEFVLHAEDGSISVNRAPQAAAGPAGGDGESVASDESASMTPFHAQLSPDIIVDLVDVNGVDHMSADEVHVRFYPNGTSDEFQLVIRSVDNQYRMIQLEVVTAIASVESDPLKFAKR
jgi:prepilin-type N-terminal cleavage/methylation domain-containing protein